MTANKKQDAIAPESGTDQQPTDREVAGAAFEVIGVMCRNMISGKTSPLDSIVSSRAVVDMAISMIAGCPEVARDEPMREHARGGLAKAIYDQFVNVHEHANRGGEVDQACAESIAIALLRVAAHLITPDDAPTHSDREKISANGGSVAAIADARWSRADRSAKLYVPNGCSFRISFANQGYWELLSCPRKPAIAKANVKQLLAELCEFVVVALMREHHKPAD